MSDRSIGWLESVARTNDFYRHLKGQSYTDNQVDRWLSKWFIPYVPLSGDESVLDLCSGDGVWAFGLLRKFPNLKVSGVDISDAAVDVATQRALRLQLRDRAIFISHDCETELPFAMNTFDIIFARGVFVFNQHDMMRPGCLDLLQHWHYLLNKKGRFVAMYGSKPERFGTYTPATETKGLPTNLFARETAAVNFRAGKFNHSPSSFISPFLELESVMLDAYHFSHGRHTLITKHNHSESPQV